MFKIRITLAIIIALSSAVLLNARLMEKGDLNISKDEIASLEKSGHLASVGKNSWKTRGGLFLKGKDPDGKTRLEHIMRHSSDSPSRPKHGVFSISKAEIIELLDETWSKTAGDLKNGPERGGKTVFTYDTGRDIGYLGGREGMNKNHPKLRSVRLVVNNKKEVITFFPY
jgi:hypothetical protein